VTKNSTAVLDPKKSNPKPPAECRMPDWEEVHRELSQRERRTTLTLLWQEYREKHPNGYGFTQFRVYYQGWNKDHTNTMRLPHKAGVEM
jgi:transposase